MNKVSSFESAHALEVGTRLDVGEVRVGAGAVSAGCDVITDTGALDTATGTRVRGVGMSTGSATGAVEGLTEIIDGASEPSSTGGDVAGAPEST